MGARSQARNRLRLVYFAVASIWGFLIGTAGVLGGLAAAGEAPEADLALLAALGGTLLLALAGAWVAARAYRDAARRQSR